MFDAAVIEVLQIKDRRDMGSDLECGATKARLKPRAQHGLLRLRHARLTTFQAILPIGHIPARGGVIAHVETLCDLGAALPMARSNTAFVRQAMP